MIDTSALTSATTFVLHEFLFLNCKFKTGYQITDGTFDAANAVISIINCSENDSDNLLTRLLRSQGDSSTSLTVYRDSGYQDIDSDTNLSQLVAPTSRCSIPFDMDSPPIMGLVDSTGSKTFTVELTENYTTELTERECWLEVFYFDSASNTYQAVEYGSREFAQASYTALSAGVGLANWTGEPAGSRSVKLSTTVTVNKVGLYKVVVHVGKYEAGKVVHIDPMVNVT